MIIETGRFGHLKVGEKDKFQVPQGLLGFPEYQEFVLVDPGDDTLIMWLQSLDNPEIAFPVIEPKIIRSDYRVRLSGNDIRELKEPALSQGLGVFCILTIPEDVTQMTANLKAPLAINLKNGVGKQIVLQENDYSIKCLMFRELRMHLMTIQASKQIGQPPVETEESQSSLVSLEAIPVNQSIEA